MINKLQKLSAPKRLASTLAVVCTVLFASWLGAVNGGYFTGEWALVTLILAVLALVASSTGVLVWTSSRWVILALALFAAYTVWTFLSMIWSPNKGDAWIGGAQTLLYLLVFWISVGLVSLDASRRWALIASSLGPAVIAALTLTALPSLLGDLFENGRLVGSVGYYNGEAAFLLVPFWTSIYLSGSQLIHPILRGLVLSGAVLSLEVAVLSQSRGAMVAMALSLPVFFLLSGQRLRSLLALSPVVLSLILVFPSLNEVYLEFRNQGSPDAALERMVPLAWIAAAGAGLYGLVWGFIDRRWQPPIQVVRAAGSLAIASVVIATAIGGIYLNERGGSPIARAEQQWEAFKTNDTSGQEVSRFLSASGTGRYALWEVAWKDFVSRPVLGVGAYNYEATYYRLRDSGQGFARQPHMLPLEVLAEKGIVGGLLFFGFLGSCVLAGLWKRFSHLNTEGKAQVGAIVAAFTYWFVHSSAEWFWQIPAVSMPVMVYLAMLVAPWGRDEVDPPRWSLRLVGAGATVLVIAAVFPIYAANQLMQRSEEMANPQAALRSVERAQFLNPVAPNLRQREAELAMQAGDWSRAESAYSKTIQLNPEHYAPYMLSALYHEKRGNEEKALYLYRKAASFNPRDRDLDERVEHLRGSDEKSKD